MGKRSDFKRRPMDKYLTFDERAYPKLNKFLPERTKFWEPCAGAGHIADNLEALGHECVAATDLEPQCERVFRLDALETTRADVDATGAEFIITNPVWTRPLLHRFIEHFARMRPTWLLFDHDWICTPQTHMARRNGVLDGVELRKYCHLVVPVGRLRWIEGTKMSGKDNCNWYLFDFSRPGRMEIAE